MNKFIVEHLGLVCVLIVVAIFICVAIPIYISACNQMRRAEQDIYIEQITPEGW